jgi:PAP2 superfamily protein
MSASAQAKWLVIAAFVALDAIGLARFGMALRWASLAPLASAVIVFAGVAGFYTYRRPDTRIVDLAHTAAQLMIFFAAAAVCDYVLVATALPLVDQQLAAADRLLGFDWPAWSSFVQQHPLLQRILKLTYASAMLQIAIITVYLALSGQPQRTSEFLWTMILSLIIIMPVSVLLPAAGAFAYYDVVGLVDAAWVPEFAAVRDGQLHSLDLAQLQGLINFPSFHTALGVLFAYVLRRSAAAFAIASLLNGVMIIAVPSEGGHYVVDVIAGAGVAGLAIWATAWIEAALRSDAPQGAALTVHRGA